MSDEQDKEQEGIVGWIIGIAAFIAVAVALWMGLLGGMSSETGDKKASPVAVSAGPAVVPSVSPASVTPASVTPASVSAASTAAKPETIKIYFDTGSVALPVSVSDGIKTFVTYAQSSPNTKLQISGFHDKTGSVDQNAELSKNRAKAVRDVLISAGVPEDRIVLQRPSETSGGGDDKEARRVELSAVQ